MIAGGRLSWILVVAALVLAAAFGVVVWRDAAQLPIFVGRFHSLFVHVPIGGLLVATLLAVVSKTDRGASARVALRPVLVFCAASAVLSVVAGQLLASTGGHSGPTLDWHATLGYGVALVTLLAAAVAWGESTDERRRGWRVSDLLIGLAVVLLVVAGHLGGTLSRGPDYLTEHLPSSLRALVSGEDNGPASNAAIQPRDVIVYTSVVAPILQTRCVSCHGPSEAQGGLRLDAPEHITAGGDSGPVLVAGDAAHSELIRRLWLPATHPDVMPPRGRSPISVAEAGLLRWWIDGGASFEHTLADVEVPADVRPALESHVGVLAPAGPAILSLDVPPLPSSVLADLVKQGLPVSRLSEQTAFLQVQARGLGQAFDDAKVQALLPAAAQITWLDLGGTAVTDAAMEVVARFPHLSRLHLDRTTITDEGIARLTSLEHLEYLNLYGTGVSDAAIDVLAALPRLRTLYLWQTGVTAAGVDRLKSKRSALDINTGYAAEAEKVE